MHNVIFLPFAAVHCTIGPWTTMIISNGSLFLFDSSLTTNPDTILRKYPSICYLFEFATRCLCTLYFTWKYKQFTFIIVASIRCDNVWIILSANMSCTICFYFGHFYLIVRKMSLECNLCIWNRCSNFDNTLNWIFYNAHRL